MIFGEEGSQTPQPRPQQQQQEIRLDLSTMETFYANFFAMAGSADEVILYFGTNSPMPGANVPIAKVSHRLMLLPSNAKRLMLALQQTVQTHEDRFGPIEITPRPPQGGKG